MPVNEDGKYVPSTFDEKVDEYRLNYIRLVRPDDQNFYDLNNFVNTNAYLFTYAVAQDSLSKDTQLVEIENRFFELFQDIQNQIQYSKTSTEAGVVESILETGVKQVALNTINPGTLIIATYNPDGVSDQYIGQAIHNSLAVGIFTELGTNSADVSASNGQVFTYNWTEATVTPIYIRIEWVKSAQGVLPGTGIETSLTEAFLEGVEKYYRLGRDFEPERYINLEDFPFLADVRIGHNLTGGSDPYDFDVLPQVFGQLLEFSVDNIVVTEVV